MYTVYKYPQAPVRYKVFKMNRSKHSHTIANTYYAEVHIKTLKYFIEVLTWHFWRWAVSLHTLFCERNTGLPGWPCIVQ